MILLGKIKGPLKKKNSLLLDLRGRGLIKSMERSNGQEGEMIFHEKIKVLFFFLTKLVVT